MVSGWSTEGRDRGKGSLRTFYMNMSIDSLIPLLPLRTFRERLIISCYCFLGKTILRRGFHTIMTLDFTSFFSDQMSQILRSPDPSPNLGLISCHFDLDFFKNEVCSPKVSYSEKRLRRRLCLSFVGFSRPPLHKDRDHPSHPIY